MARPSIHKLLLTFDEMIWIVRTVQRKAELAKKVEKDKRLAEMVMKFADKFAELPTPEADGISFLLKTNRNEIRFLHEVVRNTHASAVATIIPGYAEKISAAPESEKERLQAYLLKAQEQAGLLVSLRNKIERVL